MDCQPSRLLATASRRRRAFRANRFRAKLRFLPCFEGNSETGHMPERRALSWSNDQTGVGVFGKRRSDARHEPVFPALSFARKWRIHAAPRTSTRSTRADAPEHGAVSDETNIQVYPRHRTVPLVCLPRGNAAIAAYQARGHLHFAVAYSTRSGRTNKRDAFTSAPVRMP